MTNPVFQAAIDLFSYRETKRHPYPIGVPVAVCDKFENLALDVIDMGFRRYSSDAILHRIRWHFQIERGDRGFKCNDHWTAPLARWFMKLHPEHDGFFELRERTEIDIDA